MTTDDAIECPDCGGQGYTEEDYADRRGEHCTRTSSCDRCDGTGEIAAAPEADAAAFFRAEYVSLCAEIGTTITDEQQALLSIGGEFLPGHAIAVRDGGTPAPTGPDGRAP